MTELNTGEDQVTRAEENTDGRPVSIRPTVSHLAEGLVRLPHARKTDGWRNLLDSLAADQESENEQQ